MIYFWGLTNRDLMGKRPNCQLQVYQSQTIMSKSDLCLDFEHHLLRDDFLEILAWPISTLPPLQVKRDRMIVYLDYLLFQLKVNWELWT